MTTYTYQKAVDPSALASAVLSQMGLRLEAEMPTDSVNGFIETSGGQTKVTFYDADEPPNSHQTTFVKTVLTSTQVSTLDFIVSGL